MRPNRLIKWLLIAMLLLLFEGLQTAAQEEFFVIAHQDVFAELTRSSVRFPHSLHEEALEDQGCGICHHVWDTEQKKLLDADGEEQECKTCHGRSATQNAMPLREAFHQSCTGCHRNLAKKGTPYGPTTCGECHKKGNE